MRASIMQGRVHREQKELAILTIVHELHAEANDLEQLIEKSPIFGRALSVLIKDYHRHADSLSGKLFSSSLEELSESEQFTHRFLENGRSKTLSSIIEFLQLKSDVFELEAGYEVPWKKNSYLYRVNLRIVMEIRLIR